jgi:ribosomal protein L13E
MLEMKKRRFVGENESNPVNQMSYNNYQSHKNSSYSEEGEVKDTIDLWTPPEGWTRLKVTSDSNENRFIYFPFELSEEDYIRRIYSVFSECLSEKIASILCQSSFGPFPDDVDILTLLNSFHFSFANQDQTRGRHLKELFSRFPKVDLQQLSYLTTVFHEHRCVLFQSTKKTAQKEEFDLTNLFQLAKEFIICFETIPLAGETQRYQINTKDALEELVDWEEQYWHHKNFKDKRMNFLGWKNGGLEEERSERWITNTKSHAAQQTISSSNGFNVAKNFKNETSSNAHQQLHHNKTTHSNYSHHNSFTNNYNNLPFFPPPVPPANTFPPAIPAHAGSTGGVKSALQYKQQGYSAKQLKEEGNFSAKQLLMVNFSLPELKEAGYNAYQLRIAGITAKQCLSVGYTAQQCKEGNFTIQEFQKDGLSAAVIKEAGFAAAQFLSVGFSLKDAIETGYTLAQLHGAKVLATELIQLGCSLTQLKESGYTAKQLRETHRSITVKELKEAGFTALQLTQAEYPLAELIAVGYSAGNLKGAQYKAKDLISSQQFTPEQLREAGFSVKDLKNFVKTPLELRLIGFSANQLKEAGFSSKELKEIGYSSAQMKSAKVSLEEMKSLGFTVAEMRNASVSGVQLKSLGYTAYEMREGGFTANQLKSFGYSPNELLTAEFSIHQIREAGYTAEEILEASSSSSLSLSSSSLFPLI